MTAIKTMQITGKSVRLQDLPAEAWTILSGGESGNKTRKYMEVVDIYHRCVNLRADAMAHIPFAVVKNGTDLDVSATWQNKVGFLPNPRKLFRRIEMALMQENAAYMILESNAFDKPRDLRFLASGTVVPKFDPDQGLTGYVRGNRDYTPDEIAHIWIEDNYTELGPSQATIARAVASSCSVIYATQVFTASFIERGMVKATVIGVPRNTQQEERDRLKEFFQGMLGGMKNANRTEVINADDVKPTVIGEGLEALRGVTVTAEAREAIAIATGIPMSMLMSNAANYATANQDEKNLLNWAVMPHAEYVQDDLNDQVFGPMGYRFEFRPESMEVFQEEEVQRASAFAAYVTAGTRPSIAAQIVGIEMPQGVDYTALDEKYNEPTHEPTPVPAAPLSTEPEREQDDDEEAEDLKRWQRKALKWIERGKSLADMPFESEHIQPETVAAIRSGLAGCETREAVVQLFGAGPVRAIGLVDVLAALTDEIKATRMALEDGN